MPTGVKSSTFIDQIEGLPPLAGIVERVLTVTESPDSSASDVAKVLSGDPTIAAKILRVANSPFYGAGREVTQVSRAVVMLGSVAVRNLVVGICSRDAISSSATQAPEHGLIWRHSIAVASACDLIARQVGFKPPEEAFLGGLLHDIGQLAMVTFQVEAFRTVFEDQGKGTHFLDLERMHLGIDHTEAGGRILTRWGLPSSLCSVVRHHHACEFDEQDAHSRLLAIIILGDVFAHVVGIGFDLPAGRYRRAATSTRFLKLADSDQLHILDGLERRIGEVTEMFASTDSASPIAEQPACTRAIWISQDDQGHYSVGQLLLEHRGYEVQRVRAECLSSTMALDDLVLIDLQATDDAAADRLAHVLAGRGFQKIVILAVKSEGGITRQCDSDNGVCRIPRLFTAFDLKWIEEQLQL